MVPNTKYKPGFTLIEVLVAATIIALLTSIGVVSIRRPIVRPDAKESLNKFKGLTDLSGRLRNLSD